MYWPAARLYRNGFHELESGNIAHTDMLKVATNTVGLFLCAGQWWEVALANLKYVWSRIKELAWRTDTS